MAAIAESVPVARHVQLGDRPDVPGDQLRNRDLLLAPHHKDLGQPLLLALVHVEEMGVRAHGPPENAEIGQFPDEGIRRDLEHVGHGRPGRIRLDGLRLPVGDRHRLDRLRLQGRGGQLDQQVQQRADADG